MVPVPGLLAPRTASPGLGQKAPSLEVGSQAETSLPTSCWRKFHFYLHDRCFMGQPGGGFLAVAEQKFGLQGEEKLRSASWTEEDQGPNSLPELCLGASKPRACRTWQGLTRQDALRSFRCSLLAVLRTVSGRIISCF